MPAFFEAEFWSLANPELWVGVGLLAFIAILWMTGAFKMAMSGLDAKAQKIQSDLDEAARIRSDAEALLADIRKQRAEAEAQAKTVLAAAQEEAKRLAEEAKAKLEETVTRRAALAERKIANAQAEAEAQVKAAAVDLAAQAAEAVLASRLAGAKTDALADSAIGELAGKLQ
jgi:F-type H+-transporting ATPase subunit b